MTLRAEFADYILDVLVDETVGAVQRVLTARKETLEAFRASASHP